MFFFVEAVAAERVRGAKKGAVRLLLQLLLQRERPRLWVRGPVVPVLLRTTVFVNGDERAGPSCGRDRFDPAGLGSAGPEPGARGPRECPSAASI